MHVKVGASDLDAMDAALASVERLTEEVLPTRAELVGVASGPGRSWLQDYLLGRIETLARRADVPVPVEARSDLVGALERGPPPARSDQLAQRVRGLPAVSGVPGRFRGSSGPSDSDRGHRRRAGHGTRLRGLRAALR